MNDFKSLISAENFMRLKEFMHIDSVESLRSFSEFIDGLGVKKIQGMFRTVEFSTNINILFSRLVGAQGDE